MRGIIWRRGSTDHQEILTQDKDLTAMAIDDGFNVDELIHIGNAGASAIKQNKLYLQEVNELLTTLENDQTVKTVYVWEISRLARVELAFYKMKDYFINNKVQLICKTPTLRLFDDDGKLNSGSELTLSLLVTLAKQEMEQKKERFARGKARNKAEGKYNGGRIKIGYALKPDKHFKEGEDADVVRRVFNMYLQDGGSCTSIYRHMSALGYFKPFHRNASGSKQIARLLSDKAYIGEGLYPRLIDDDTFNKVQAKLATYSIRHNTKDIYYCRGLLHDTVTDTYMYASRSSIAYKSRKTVRTISLSINAMDWMVWHCAFMLLAVYDDDMNSQKEKEYKVKIEENKTKIASFTSEIEEYRGKIDRAIDRNIDQPKYYPYERMQATIKQCEKEIEKLTKDIANMQTDNQRMQDFLDGIESHTVMYRMNGDWTDEAKKEIIDKLIERIDITEVGDKRFTIKVINKIGYIDNSYWEYATLGAKIQLIWVNNDVRIDFSENVRLEKRFERKRYE